MNAILLETVECKRSAGMVNGGFTGMVNAFLPAAATASAQADATRGSRQGGAGIGFRPIDPRLYMEMR